MITDYVEDEEATGKVIGVNTIDPEENPELEKAGFHSETTVYYIFGATDTDADYKMRRLVNQKQGDWSWLKNEFRRLENQL